MHSKSDDNTQFAKWQLLWAVTLLGGLWILWRVARANSSATTRATGPPPLAPLVSPWSPLQ